MNLGYEHTFRLAGGARVVLGADTRLESSRYLSLDFLDLGRQDAYSLSNARITYEASRGATPSPRS